MKQALKNATPTFFICIMLIVLSVPVWAAGDKLGKPCQSDSDCDEMAYEYLCALPPAIVRGNVIDTTTLVGKCTLKPHAQEGEACGGVEHIQCDRAKNLDCNLYDDNKMGKCIKTKVAGLDEECGGIMGIQCDRTKNLECNFPESVSSDRMGRCRVARPH